MLDRLRGKLSYANVIATMALFVALGGGAYAAGLIGPDDIKDNAIHARHIQDGAVTDSKLGAKVGRVIPFDITTTETGDFQDTGKRLRPLGIGNSCSPNDSFKSLVFGVPDSFTQVAALSWFYSDGTNTHTSEVFVSPADAPNFNYGGGGRIEGQFIFSTEHVKITVNLHAANNAGSDICEAYGTAAYARQ